MSILDNIIHANTACFILLKQLKCALGLFLHAGNMMPESACRMLLNTSVQASSADNLIEIRKLLCRLC